jgi:hypothetical protein
VETPSDQGGNPVTEAPVLDLEQLWGQSLADLQEHLSGAALRAWLDETHPVGFSQDTVVLAAPTASPGNSSTPATGLPCATRSPGRRRPLTVVVTVRPDPPVAPRPPRRPRNPPSGASGYAPESFPARRGAPGA